MSMGRRRFSGASLVAAALQQEYTAKLRREREEPVQQSCSSRARFKDKTSHRALFSVLVQGVIKYMPKFDYEVRIKDKSIAQVA